VAEEAEEMQEAEAAEEGGASGEGGGLEGATAAAAAAGRAAGARAFGAEDGTCVDYSSARGGRCLCPVLHSGVRCPGAAGCECPDRAVNTEPYAKAPEGVPLPTRAVPTQFTGHMLLNQEWIARKRQRLAARDPRNAAKLLKAPLKLEVDLPGKRPRVRRVGTVKRTTEKKMARADPVARKRHASCAVVGNSGILLMHRHGAEIDAHDAVFRFNGAPTRGLEAHVGGRTDFRITNQKWLGTRETKEEFEMTQLRGAGQYDTYERRMEGGRTKVKVDYSNQMKWKEWKETGNYFLFTPDFVDYLAQTAFELGGGYTHLEGFSNVDFTPTGGLTGILMALNMCSAIDLYGFHVSQAHGVPYHYHNRCPQPCESALRWSARLVGWMGWMGSD